METIVYFIRHSKKLEKEYIDSSLDDENYQIMREKIILSVEGEKRAEELSNNKEFDDVDVIYSSNYTRAIQTAKYLAEKKNIKIIIEPRFGERKHGIFTDKITLKEYYEENYKNKEGESPNEVKKRTYEALMDILKENKGKKIAIYSHAGAITFLLTNWCKLENITEDKRKTLSLDGKVIIDKVFYAPDVFKLVFDEANNLKKIENIDTNS